MTGNEKLSQEALRKLFSDYKKSRDTALRNELVMAYSHIAKSVASQMRGVASSYSQMEDIVNQGMITLIDCVEKFNEDKGVRFEAYAYAKIKNSIIDFMRKQDFLPRRVRKLAKEIHAAEKALEDKHFREPTLSEVAEYMGLEVEKLSIYYAEISRSSLISLDELYHTDSNDNEFDVQDNKDEHIGLFKEEQKEYIIKALETLNERERTIISLYYYEKLKIQEIAQILSVSESRISQLHVKALNKLKNVLQSYIYD